MFEVIFLTPQKVLFEGQSESIILPGEKGTFEVMSFHKDLLTRLLRGWVIIDKREKIPIQRGVVKIERNTVTIIAEPPYKAKE